MHSPIVKVSKGIRQNYKISRLFQHLDGDHLKSSFELLVVCHQLQTLYIYVCEGISLLQTLIMITSLKMFLTLLDVVKLLGFFLTNEMQFCYCFWYFRPFCVVGQCIPFFFKDYIRLLIWSILKLFKYLQQFFLVFQPDDGLFHLY